MPRIKIEEGKSTKELKWENPELVRFGNSGLGQAAPICEVQGSTPGPR